jgi:hypothetical protein
MTNDLVPQNASGNFLEQFNLPKLLAGPAGEAVSRLIGGAAEIPAAWLRRVTQGIDDKTEAKSVVSKAVADAAANLAKNDPEIVQRAAHNLLSKELRHQSNREAIARKTIELLQQDENNKGPTSEQSHHKVDEDWLNIFERYAEEASSVRLQDVWARVLSGEIRHPKTFSLQTLRFVAELDEEIAASFEKYVPSVVNEDFIPFPSSLAPHPQSIELFRLEEFGLILGAQGTLSKSVTREKGAHGFHYKSHTLVLVLGAKQEIVIPAVVLTRVGKEIYSITHANDDVEQARRFAKRYRSPTSRAFTTFLEAASKPRLPLSYGASALRGDATQRDTQPAKGALKSQVYSMTYMSDGRFLSTAPPQI